MAFTNGMSAERGGWARAARDPHSAAAMRHLRRRVEQLRDPHTAMAPSAWATRYLNGRDGRPAPPRQMEFRTSVIHPLYGPEVLRPRTPRTPAELDPTSFWCATWGASASTKAIDQNFLFTREAMNRSGPGPKLDRPAWGAGLKART